VDLTVVKVAERPAGRGPMASDARPAPPRIV